MTTKGFGMVIAAVAVLLAAAPSQVFADKGGKHHGRKGYVATTVDHKHRGLPPGLAKRESLPPGLARQLHERGRLPPGLQKRLTPVPAGWGRSYPAWSPHHARYFAGRDLVIVDTRTHRVVSIVRNAR
jgi:hypothetical protein